ncbi:MAG: hypothetical protein KJ749_09825 [Planctomycetes bacterium]|nr:hypothetical protein [Planctomycetota bacterium]
MSSVLGAHEAQKQSEQKKVRESSDQAERAGTEKFADRLKNIIKETDPDSEVYEDAEGLGSQGRPFSEEEEHLLDDDEDEADESAGGLDIQA